jgi:hypothetical protein
VTVSQRIVELVIGRLITDEEFRIAFLNAPVPTLEALCARGLELTRTEIAALSDTDRTLWLSTAERVDPRLQKVSLLTEPVSPKESDHHV